MNRENWQVKKLGEVCLIQRGGSPRPINEYITDSEKGLNWIKIGDTTPNSRYITKTAEKIKPEGLSKTRLVHRGDFLLSNSMSFGRPYILEIDGCIHDGWLVIHDEKKVFDKNFLYYLLSSSVIKSKFELLAVGGVVNNLNSKMVRNLEIPIPPLPIQEAIVKELDSLHRLKELQEQQLTEYDNLAQCTFYSMFGDPIENDRDWEVRKMGEVAPVSSFKRKLRAIDNKYWLLNLDAVEQQSGEILFINIVDKKEINQSTVTFNEDNVLYSKLRPYLNKVVIPFTSGYCTSELLPLSPNKELLNRVFLALLLRSSAFVEYIQEKTNGAKMPRVNMDEFREFNLIIPPLPLQSQFAERIEKIEAQKELVKQGIDQTQLLIDYTMDKYFN